MPELLEKKSYTNWLTVLYSPGKKSLEEQRNNKGRYYEYHFYVEARAAIFSDLTRVEYIDGNRAGFHKNPDWIPPEVGEEITSHHPKLQPIVRWEEYETPQCIVCQSNLVYSTSREEYFCPWCHEP